MNGNAAVNKNLRSPHEGEPNRSSRFGGGYSPRNTTLAQTMRKAMTPWEQKLWQHLKAKQLAGFKFRRQQPIGNFIVDFLNVDRKLIVELDGSQHMDCASDQARDAFLTAAGYCVLRFWNNDVDTNIEGVLSTIQASLESPPHQIPSGIWLPLEGGAKAGQS